MCTLLPIGHCLCQPYNVQYLAFYQYIISILIHMHRMQSAMFYWCDYLGLTLTYACGLLNMFLVLCLYLHLYSD